MTNAAPAPGPLARAAASLPPEALLLVSIVSIQLGAAVAVNLFPVIGPVATVFLRLAFAAALLLVAARRSIRTDMRRHASWLLVYGAVLAAMNLTFYASIARIPLGIAVAIEFVGPLGLAVATSRRPRDFAWIGLAALGILLLVPEIGETLDALGVALAAMAGLCWAAFIMLSRRIGRIASGSSALAIGLAVAAIMILPVEFAVGGLDRIDLIVLLAAIAVAVLSTALPLSLEFAALRRITPRGYGIFMTLEPVAAALIGSVLLARAIGVEGIASVACVTIAALGVTISDRRDGTS